MASATPLSTLYLQVEQGQSPAAVLGIDINTTRDEVREAYHALALRLHPDKAPTDSLRELHTSLFKKVNAAYKYILANEYGHNDDSEDEVDTPKQLPETWESLHTRNVAFKEALRQAREGALEAKRIREDKTVVRGNGGRLSKRQVQALKQQQKVIEKREEKMRRDEELEKDSTKRIEELKTETKKTPLKAVQVEDWEEEENYLQEQDQLQAARAEASKAAASQRPLQRPTTSTPGAGVGKGAFDVTLTSRADTEALWHKSLLSGGRSGTVSLSQKKARDENERALMHRKLMVINGSTHSAGSNSGAALDWDDAMEYEAFVGTEIESDIRTLRALEAMDRDVIEEHLWGGLEDMRAMIMAEAKEMGLLLE